MRCSALRSKAAGSCCATPEVLTLAQKATEMTREEGDQISCLDISSIVFRLALSPR